MSTIYLFLKVPEVKFYIFFCKIEQFNIRTDTFSFRKMGLLLAPNQQKASPPSPPFFRGGDHQFEFAIVPLPPSPPSSSSSSFTVVVVPPTPLSLLLLLFPGLRSSSAAAQRTWPPPPPPPPTALPTLIQLTRHTLSPNDVKFSRQNYTLDDKKIWLNFY